MEFGSLVLRYCQSHMTIDGGEGMEPQGQHTGQFNFRLVG